MKQQLLSATGTMLLWSHTFTAQTPGNNSLHIFSTALHVLPSVNGNRAAWHRTCKSP